MIFAGTPSFAATHLRALLAAHYPIVAVLTQPDRLSGRGKKQTMSPVKECALAHELPVLQPTSLKEPGILDSLAAYQPSIILVVAYGLIFPQALLSLPPLGCLNVHASLLPRWRGAAPIQHAIWAGDSETGVCVQQMEAGLDTGPILHYEKTAIQDTETSGTLLERLSHMGARLLCEVLDRSAHFPPQAQSLEGISLAPKIYKHQGAIDWMQSAAQIERQIRAFDPEPGTFTALGNNLFKLTKASLGTPRPLLSADSAGSIVSLSLAGMEVQCGDGTLCITEIQFPGKAKQTIAERLKTQTLPFKIGDRLHGPI